MGLLQSPKVATDGLVFYYDQNNIKSYQGPAIQNLASTITALGNINTGINIVGGSETVNVPQIGPTNVAFNNIQNNHTVFSPNAVNACCPNVFRYTGTWGSGFTVSPSTLYTYGIVYKVNSGYTDANFMYRYEFTSNGGSYVTEAGVHNTTNRIHLGDGWYWAWGTFTTQSTTNWIQYAGAWYYRYSNVSDKMSIAKVLITPGNYTGLHPRFWPDVNTTRASTQVLSDLSRNNTLIANTVTYASSGTISFNGTSSHLSIPSTSSLQVGTVFTINAWVRPTSLTTRSGIFSTRIANEAGSWQLEVGPANGTNRIAVTGVGTWIWESSDNAVAVNNWINICYVRSADSGTMYVNGSQVTPVTTTAYSILNNSSNDVIGSGTSLGQFFTGSIDVVSLYNRMLNATEVQQNFNALRGRFGI